jgi:hypothetical protein
MKILFLASQCEISTSKEGHVTLIIELSRGFQYANKIKGFLLHIYCRYGSIQRQQANKMSQNCGNQSFFLNF